MLTNHQRQVLNDLLKSNSKIVQLTGSAGCGKSFTIASFINSTQDTIELTATTNKASANLYEMAGANTSVGTIHKWLGFTMAQGQLIRRGDTPKSSCDYLIVDESSMLTKQIMEAIQLAVDTNYVMKKVILVGDAVQLNIDEHLDLNQYPSFELTQQMRQKASNSLSELLVSLRAKVVSKGLVERINTTDDSLIRYDTHEEFLTAYKKSEEEKIILAYKNQTVRSYNNNITKLLHKKPSKYNAGDFVTSTAPVFLNGEMIIHNRETVEITDVTEEDYVFSVTVKGYVVDIPKSKAWLDRELQKFVDNKDWKSFYEKKESYLTCHHAYAGTTHSAQGISVDEVFIDIGDFTPPNDPLSETLHRLLYVSASRARKRVHFYTGREHNFKALA